MEQVETDVVVIGSGIGGLSCAALLAKYGFEVTVCESHAIPGGAAHGFERQGFRFDSGPSLYSGLSSSSPNPLRQILDAIGEDVEWATYDTWGCCLPEGDFDTTVGADQFCDILQNLRGREAVAQWRQLQQVMAPLKDAAIALPPAAMRFDFGAFRTLPPFLFNLIRHAPQITKLTGPFSQITDGLITDPFIKNWLDLLCFLLSGLPADGTIAAEVAFMFAEWYRPGVVLDYPLGGSEALVNACVRGLERHGGTLMLNAHVEQVLVQDKVARNKLNQDKKRQGFGKRAVGVRLRNGQTIYARQAVVSNASVWNTLNLLPDGSIPQRFRTQRHQTPECDSFMHLHLGIDATGLRSDLACHYIVVNDWSLGINAPQNVVLISIPSLLDPTLAPLGKHTIHAYTPGNEPYALWQGLDRQSPAYQDLKRERSQVLWTALERVIPDVRSRCDLTLVGTPLTHERFLRRHRGSYGPAIRAGQGVFPGPRTPLPRLFCCGDSTFPGIGLPAVAASGMITANTLAPVAAHLQLLNEIGCIS